MFIFVIKLFNFIQNKYKFKNILIINLFICFIFNHNLWLCLLNHSNQKLYSIKSRFTPSKKKMLYSFVTNPSLEFFISGIQIPLLNKIHRTKKLILIKLHRISCDRVSINYLRSFF